MMNGLQVIIRSAEVKVFTLHSLTDSEMRSVCVGRRTEMNWKSEVQYYDWDEGL